MKRIEFTVTEDDFVNASCFAAFRRKATQKLFRRIKIFTAVLLPSIVCGFYYLYYGEDWLKPQCILSMLIPILLSAHLVINLPRSMRKDMRKKIRKMIREAHREHFEKSVFMKLRDDGLFYHCVKLTN